MVQTAKIVAFGGVEITDSPREARFPAGLIFFHMFRLVGFLVLGVFLSTSAFSSLLAVASPPLLFLPLFRDLDFSRDLEL